MFKFLKKFVADKRGILDGVVPIAITFVATVIVVAISAQILGTFQTTAGATNGTTNGGNAVYNITGNGVGGIGQMSGYFPVIGLVVIAAIVIGVLLAAFSFKSA